MSRPAGEATEAGTRDRRRPYMLTISPEGLKLVPKGKRNGVELRWARSRQWPGGARRGAQRLARAPDRSWSSRDDRRVQATVRPATARPSHAEPDAPLPRARDGRDASQSSRRRRRPQHLDLAAERRRGPRRFRVPRRVRARTASRCTAPAGRAAAERCIAGDLRPSRDRPDPAASSQRVQRGFDRRRGAQQRPREALRSMEVPAAASEFEQRAARRRRGPVQRAARPARRARPRQSPQLPQQFRHQLPVSCRAPPAIATT